MKPTCKVLIRVRATVVVVAGVVLAMVGSTTVHAQEAGLGTLADAGPGDVRLFVAGSFRAPVLAMRARLERATGRKVVVESSESRVLQQKMVAGQPFEVALLIKPVIDAMISQGRIVAGSDRPMGAVGVGVSVRGDAPQLDVTTEGGLRSAILGARGIRRFYGVAASVPVLDNLFARLGLVEATRERMIRLGSGEIAPEAPLPRGQYELIINLISAIKPLPGWTYLGPIPQQFQMPVIHAAALGAAGDQMLGQKVMAVFKEPAFLAALREGGITVD